MASQSVDTLSLRYGAAYRWLVTITGMTGAMVMILASTMVNVAIPAIMGTYGVGQDQAQWMSTAFLATMTASQLLGAWVIAAFGARGGYLGSVVIFIAGSLICAFAPNIDVLIFGRIVQGFAAGVIQPLVMVTIFQVFPSDRRGMAMGIFGVGLSLAVAVGPAFGGIAIDMFDWRSIFCVPLPMVAIAFVLGLIFMPSHRAAKGQPFDWSGYALVLIALYCVVTGLTDGQRDGWTSTRIVGLFAAAFIASAGFLVSQMRARETLVDLSLFRNREFTAIIVITMIFGIGNFGTGYAVPVFGLLVQGMTPLDAGLVVMPAALMVAVALPFTGRLADTIAPRNGILVGLCLFAIGAAFMVDADVNTPYANVMLYYAIGRFGMSFTMPFLVSTALRGLPPRQLNAGAGMVNFCRQLGGTLGTNAWVVFVQMRTQFHADAFTATQDSANVASRELLDKVGQMLREGGVSDVSNQSTALHYLGQVVHAQATTAGFQDGFLIFTVVFVLAMIPAWMLGPGRKR